MNDSISQAMLEHAFRVQDNTISTLLSILRKAEVPEDKVGIMAQQILHIVQESNSRGEIAEKLQSIVANYPELDIVAVQENLYAKSQKEKIIKGKIEELVQQDKVDEAFTLAHSINKGELPMDIQQKIDTI